MVCWFQLVQEKQVFGFSREKIQPSNNKIRVPLLLAEFLSVHNL